MERTIQNILATWNPIGVPEFIAIEEYENYAFTIVRDCKNYNEVYNYIISIYVNEMGYELTEESDLDIKNISGQISEIINQS